MVYPTIGYNVNEKDIETNIFPTSYTEDYWVNHHLPSIAKLRTDLLMFRQWIQDDEDGFTGWRKDKYNKKPIIVCAANKYGNIIVTGSRHYSVDMYLAISALGGIGLLRKYGASSVKTSEENDDRYYDQGFIDQYGFFYDRKEAWIIAVENGQIRNEDGGPEGTLYSEHLY